MRESEAKLSTATWTLADQAVVSLGNFLLNIQLARSLPISEYGVFALLFSLIFLLQHCSVALLVYPMSMRVAAAGHGRETGLMSITVTLVGACNLAFGILLAVAAVAAGRRDIALVAALFCIVWQVQDALRRCLMAEFRHREAMIGDTITYLGQAAVVAIMVRRGVPTLSGALLGMTCASLVGGLVQLRQLGLGRPQLGGLGKLLAEFWHVGRWAFVSGLMMHLRLQILPWSLTLTHGTAATAAFQAALNFANLTNPVVFGLCNTISSSTARAKAGSDNRAAWERVQFYMLLGAPIIAAYSVAVFAVPGLVLWLFYGPHSPYLAYDLAVRVIMVSIVVSYFADTYSAFLYGADEGRIATRLAFIGLVMAVGAAALVVPWAVVGAAMAMLLGNVARLLASCLSMRSVLRGRS